MLFWERIGASAERAFDDVVPALRVDDTTDALLAHTRHDPETFHSFAS
jgi:hypothetical protein